MSKEIVYGIGGFCQNCDSSHDHPLNNIILEVDKENIFLNETDKEIEEKRNSIMEKLINLGLTKEEIDVLLKI